MDANGEENIWTLTVRRHLHSTLPGLEETLVEEIAGTTDDPIGELERLLEWEFDKMTHAIKNVTMKDIVLLALEHVDWRSIAESCTERFESLGGYYSEEDDEWRWD